MHNVLAPNDTPTSAQQFMKLSFGKYKLCIGCPVFHTPKLLNCESLHFKELWQ
jgi:hypothetical protein